MSSILETQTLEDIIRAHVKLHSPNNKGWHPCVHIGGCDRGHKGARAAFNFSDDSVAFHCFNCGISTVYDPLRHRSLPKKLQKVLDDFNVPQDEWRKIVFANFGKQDQTVEQPKQKRSDIEPSPIDLPQPFQLVTETDDKWATVAQCYLQDRGIDSQDYPFMICRSDADHYWNKWKRRVIIPVYNKHNQPIFYQGRALTDNAKPKYLSPTVPKEKVLHGYQTIFDNTDDSPLFIVEGWFDAFKIDGVALLGGEITQQQAQWINYSNRQKVYIPDKEPGGLKGAKRALQLNWCVSTPDIGNCKDISDAVDYYGLLYVIKTITENIHCDMFKAQAKLGFYCGK